MKGMTRWGIGPKWALASVLGAAPFMAASAVWPNTFAIHLVPRSLLQVAGWLLFVMGIPFFSIALVTLHRGFTKGELFTRGVYGLCRHPIYASWVVFLVPGLLLILSSWMFLLVPAVMYALLRFFVRGEESWLEATFGERYHVYRARVPAVLPIPRFWLTRDRP